MKQKIIIKVQMACLKCRTKALKIAAGAQGVVSVTAQGDDALVVTGRCVDPVHLTATLRKKVGVAILLSVEEIKDPPPPKKVVESSEKEATKPEKETDKKKSSGEEEKEKPKEKEKPTLDQVCYSYGMPPPCQLPCNYYYPQQHYHQPQYCMYEIPPPDPNPPCSIM